MRDYRNIFNKVVPYHTDNSMSLYEFVGRLYEYLKDFEGSLEEAHKRIDEFITQFSTDLNDTTKQILTEWHDDGTLAELINLVWEQKADKVYVDNLINQIANTLTNNYTQADDSLRDQLTDGYTQADDSLRDQLTDGYTQADDSLRDQLTDGYTQEIARVKSDLSATQQLAEKAMEGANRTFISNARPTVLGWAMEQPLGLHYFTTDSTTPDVPAGYKFSTGICMVRNNQQRTVVIIGYETGKIVFNTHVNGGWRGWKEAC